MSLSENDVITRRITVKTTLKNILKITALLDKNLIDYSIEQTDEEEE